MVFLLFVLGLFCLDLIIKYIVEQTWIMGKEKKVCKDKIILRKLHNKGAALNLLENHKKILIFLNIFLMSGLGILFVKTISSSKSILEKLAASMLFAGGLNNLFDRIKRGYVVDYFSFNVRLKKLKAIVFNVSDIFIFIGALLFIISSARKTK